MTTQLIHPPTPWIHFTKIQFHTCSNLSTSRLLTVKCSNDNKEISEAEAEGNGGGLKKALSGIVDSRVQQLLNREENRVLLDGLDKAAERVETAKRELALIQKQEDEAKKMKEYINQLETRAAEIAECQKELSEARALVEEAEHSLNDTEREATYKNKERFESVKAAFISGLVGTLAGLPIWLVQDQPILPLAVNLMSCALFGVTFRYAVRRDLDNFQLKTGTCAAFGFVKGLATLEGGPPLELETGNVLSHAFSGAIHVSENLLIFVFAAVGLDLCIKLRILSPFPIEEGSDSSIKTD